jgi:hypothetical protein
MWELDYTDEVKFYFLDNGDLVFDVLVKIEELKFFDDSMPDEGCIEIEPELFLWQVLRHWVIFHRLFDLGTLRIAAIKPMD